MEKYKKNKLIKKKNSFVEDEHLISDSYYKKHPNITIRANLPKEILEFIKKLKQRNLGSRWINDAIKEKYYREKNEKI